MKRTIILFALISWGITVCIAQKREAKENIYGTCVCKTQTIKNPNGVVTNRLDIENLFREITKKGKMTDHHFVTQNRELFKLKIKQLNDSTFSIKPDDPKSKDLYSKQKKIVIRISKNKQLQKLKFTPPASDPQNVRYYEELWERTAPYPNS